jgi:serine/threonine protein phosphatase PrpC
LKGLRHSMEDFVYAKISEVDGQVIGLFGVFDGN